MKAYLVGIDFGNGETAAYCTPNLRYWQERDEEPEAEGPLKIRRDDDPGVMKQRTVIRVDRNGKYSLYESGMVMLGLKGKIKGMDNSIKKAYKAFIQAIYERIVENNSHLQDDFKGNSNFELCIASPTKWTKEEKEAYIAFFNKALEPYHRQVLWVINESDAAYFTHRDNSNNVLVIDYGSSTIDYTLMSHGEKVSKDSWSNELGAKGIEMAMKNAYAFANPEPGQLFSAYRRMRNQLEPLLQNRQYAYIDIEQTLELIFREAKERAYTAQSKNYYVNSDFGLFTGDPRLGNIDIKHSGYFRNYQDQYEQHNGVCENYIELVKKDFKDLKEKVYGELPADEQLNKIILSGGACNMKWVGEIVREIFSDVNTNIGEDKHKEYVVATGIARYAQEQMKALDDLRKTIADIKYDEIYEPVFVKVCKEKIVDIVEKRSTSITKIQNPNGEKIRNEYIKLIKAIDNTDEEFCSSVVNALNDTINEKIREALKSTIQNAFGIVIDVSDVAMNINPIVGRFIDKDFEPNGFFYEIVSDGIKSTICFSFLFDWDQERDQNEVREIITSVNQNIANEVLANSLKINIIDLQQRADDIQQQVLEKIDDIFYQNQLFKTTYLRTLN